MKGLAIVASRIGGFLDLVAPGENGYLIDVKDEAAFSSALRELISDRERLLAVPPRQPGEGEGFRYWEDR
ncbi:MAG: glycosyltransferase [Chloroflexi bacterium]|nr:glycosyltransferase [Chloroflexota bacterium]